MRGRGSEGERQGGGEVGRRRGREAERQGGRKFHEAQISMLVTL